MATHSIKGKVAHWCRRKTQRIDRARSGRTQREGGVHYNSASEAGGRDGRRSGGGAQAVAFGDLTNTDAIRKQTTHRGRGQPAGHCHQYRRQGAEEADSEVTEADYDEMSAVNAKYAFFFLKEAGST